MSVELPLEDNNTFAIGSLMMQMEDRQGGAQLEDELLGSIQPSQLSLNIDHITPSLFTSSTTNDVVPPSGGEAQGIPSSSLALRSDERVCERGPVYNYVRPQTMEESFEIQPPPQPPPPPQTNHHSSQPYLGYVPYSLYHQQQGPPMQYPYSSTPFHVIPYGYPSQPLEMGQSHVQPLYMKRIFHQPEFIPPVLGTQSLVSQSYSLQPLNVQPFGTQTIAAQPINDRPISTQLLSNQIINTQTTGSGINPSTSAGFSFPMPRPPSSLGSSGSLTRVAPKPPLTFGRRQQEGLMPFQHVSTSERYIREDSGFSDDGMHDGEPKSNKSPSSPSIDEEEIETKPYVSECSENLTDTWSNPSDQNFNEVSHKVSNFGLSLKEGSSNPTVSEMSSTSDDYHIHDESAFIRNSGIYPAKDRVQESLYMQPVNSMQNEPLKEFYTKKGNSSVTISKNIPKTSKDLKRIEQKLSNSSLIPLRCTKCEYVSYNKSNFKNHMFIHSEERQFACSMCSYRGKQSAGLRAHLKVHSLEKPFKCSVCNYTCKRKQNLIQHFRIHSKLRPFLCSYCSYRSTTKQSLQKHTFKHFDNSKSSKSKNVKKSIPKTNSSFQQDKPCTSKPSSEKECVKQGLKNKGKNEKQINAMQGTITSEESVKTLSQVKCLNDNSGLNEYRMMIMDSLAKQIADQKWPKGLRCSYCNFESDSISYFINHLHLGKKCADFFKVDGFGHSKNCLTQNEKDEKILNGSFNAKTTLECPYCKFNAHTLPFLKLHISKHSDDVFWVFNRKGEAVSHQSVHHKFGTSVSAEDNPKMTKQSTGEGSNLDIDTEDIPRQEVYSSSVELNDNTNTLKNNNSSNTSSYSISKDSGYHTAHENVKGQNKSSYRLQCNFAERNVKSSNLKHQNRKTGVFPLKKMQDLNKRMIRASKLFQSKLKTRTSAKSSIQSSLKAKGTTTIKSKNTFGRKNKPPENLTHSSTSKSNTQVVEAGECSNKNSDLDACSSRNVPDSDILDISSSPKDDSVIEITQFEKDTELQDNIISPNRNISTINAYDEVLTTKLLTRDPPLCEIKHDDIYDCSPNLLDKYYDSNYSNTTVFAPSQESFHSTTQMNESVDVQCDDYPCYSVQLESKELMNESSELSTNILTEQISYTTIDPNDVINHDNTSAPSTYCKQTNIRPTCNNNNQENSLSNSKSTLNCSLDCGVGNSTTPFQKKWIDYSHNQDVLKKFLLACNGKQSGNGSSSDPIEIQDKEIESQKNTNPKKSSEGNVETTSIQKKERSCKQGVIYLESEGNDDEFEQSATGDNPKIKSNPSSLAASKELHLANVYTLKDQINVPQTSLIVFKCDFCDSEFKRKSSLVNHTKSHSRSEVYRCTKCPLTFKYKKAVDHHKKNHPKEVFRCTVCDFWSFRKCSLMSHFRIHKRKFNCMYCPFKCSLIKRMERHYAKHKKPEPLDRILSASEM